MPPEVEQAIDKRSSMGAVGNLNDFVKFQMAQGLAQGGAANAPAEMAMGFAFAQQMLAQQGGMLGGATATPPPVSGATAPAAAPAIELLAPADVARVLGVTEADVLATIQSGELKAKKIGAAHRITRAALDEFLKQ